jgi:hypothetical protein
LGFHFGAHWVIFPIEVGEVKERKQLGEAKERKRHHKIVIRDMDNLHKPLNPPYHPTDQRA